MIWELYPDKDGHRFPEATTHELCFCWAVAVRHQHGQGIHTPIPSPPVSNNAINLHLSLVNFGTIPDFIIMRQRN